MRIKPFEIFISESVISEEDDIFLDFKDSGFKVDTETVYYNDLDSTYYSMPRYREGEKTGTVVQLSSKVESDDSRDGFITIESYQEKQKEVLEILDKIVYRTDCKVFIKNSYPEFVFEQNVLEDSKSKLLLSLKKKIIDFIELEFPKISNREFEIKNDGKEIRVVFADGRDLFYQYSKLKKFMNSKSFMDEYGEFLDKKLRPGSVTKGMLNHGRGYTNIMGGDFVASIYIKL